MSLKQRKEIAFWFMLIVGIGVTSIQFYRYATNTLSYTTSEIVMNLIAVAFMIFPRWILNVAEKVITKNKSNES
jgi:hypothetical protein